MRDYYISVKYRETIYYKQFIFPEFIAYGYAEFHFLDYGSDCEIIAKFYYDINLIYELK